MHPALQLNCYYLAMSVMSGKTIRLSDRIAAKVAAIPVRYLYFFFMLLAVGVSLHSWFSSQDEDPYTRYNNFVIFRDAFYHLIHQQDLYILYPEEYRDLYKYSPSFALWMGAFAWMSDLPALICWNLLNVAIFIMAMRVLPVRAARMPALLLFVLIEMVIALTSSQTNVMIAGMLVLTWHYMENRKTWLATLLIVIVIYIKIFGVVALPLLLLYPQRWKAVIYTALWAALFSVMPLLVVSWDQLLFLYKSWAHLLANDHTASHGVSLIGWLYTWFHLYINKHLFVLAGAVALCLPLLRFRAYKEPLFRIYMFASVLIWVVIFNHKGESPTYIIAMIGAAIWYYTTQTTTLNKILLIGALLFTSFSSTDLITPYWIARTYVEPYAVKAVFISLIWFKLMYDLLWGHPRPDLKPLPTI